MININKENLSIAEDAISDAIENRKQANQLFDYGLSMALVIIKRLQKSDIGFREEIIHKNCGKRIEECNCQDVKVKIIKESSNDKQ